MIIAGGAALFLAAVDGVVRLGKDELAGFYINGYERKSAALERRRERLQLVLMGSSRAKYGLVPDAFERVTGLRAFNLGIPASKTLEWRILAERVFSDYRPRLVVLGVNASEMRANYLPVPGAIDLFGWADFAAYTLSDGWSTEVAEPFLQRQVGEAWAFYGRRYGLKLMLHEQLAALLPKHAQHARERREMVAAPCPDDGFEHPWLRGRNLRNLGLQLEEQGERVRAAEVPPYSPDADALRHFEELLAWFNDRGIRVAVAYLPNSPRTERRWQAVEPQMIAAIEGVCGRCAVPFFQHRDGPDGRTDYDYVEELHAGLPLARRISEGIARRIVAAKLLADDRPMFARIGEEEGGGP